MLLKRVLAISLVASGGALLPSLHGVRRTLRTPRPSVVDPIEDDAPIAAAAPPGGSDGGDGGAVGVGDVADGDGGAYIALSQEVSDSFMKYAMSTILGRALPDARDGLKPVHRRILWAMRELQLSPDGRFRKCARVVGDVIGKYHPHGDVAVYDALVRMAQDFVMSARLVDGHGNFGSMDNDPPAAMRYTECRLTRLAADALMADLVGGADVIDFTDNFDGSEIEPRVLPAKLPLLLLNGASGIAVGMATNVPPHNLGELVDALCALIDDPSLSDAALGRLVPGPDFPTGGIIMGRAGSRALHEIGRGSVVMRARTHFETIARGKSARSERNVIIATELPYQVAKADLLATIAEQINARRLDGIADLRDESDRDGVRVVFELKRDATPAVVLNNLFKTTRLQTPFSGNTLAIRTDADGRASPARLSLREALVEWLGFRRACVVRRTTWQLRKAEARDHIVEGLLKAQGDLDAVVAAVRAAADREAALAALTLAVEAGGKFALSDEQADAVLKLTLARLTSLERGKLDDEHDELTAQIGALREVLASDARVDALIVGELEELRERHAVPRRTRIEAEEGEISQEDLLANSASVIVVTRSGYVKRMAVEDFGAQARGGRGKAGTRLLSASAAAAVSAVAAPSADGEVADDEDDDDDDDSSEEENGEDTVAHFITCRDHDTVLFISDRGIAYGVRAFEVPNAGRTARGVPLPQVLPIAGNERIQAVIAVERSRFEDSDAEPGGAGDEDASVARAPSFLALMTRRGYVKKTALGAFASITARGLTAVRLDDGDALLSARLCHNDDVAVVASALGYATCFHTDEAQLRPTGRTSRGVRAMKMRADDEIVDFDILRPEESGLTAGGGASSETDAPERFVLAITENGYGKRVRASEFRVQVRAARASDTFVATLSAQPLPPHAQKRGGMGVIAIKFKNSGNDRLACLRSCSQTDQVTNAPYVRQQRIVALTLPALWLYSGNADCEQWRDHAPESRQNQRPEQAGDRSARATTRPGHPHPGGGARIC